MTRRLGKRRFSLILAALVLGVQTVYLTHLHAHAPAEPICLACALADHSDARSDSADRPTVPAFPAQAAGRVDVPRPMASPACAANSRAPPVLA